MRGYLAACVLAFLALIPLTAAEAHGTVFFEANPDYASRFNIASVETPPQLIMPPGDFWSGVDLWFDNEGPGGEAIVELRRGDGALVAAAAAHVPRRARIWGGSRLHVDFPSQIAIIPSEPYRLTVESALTDLFLYYFPRNQLLQHSSQYYPGAYGEPYLGPLWFGDTEQEFKLKLAFIELREGTPPEVRNAAVRLTSPTEAVLAFNANESVDFRADLIPEGGTLFRTEFREAYSFCPAETPPCAFTIPVFPDTNYTFELFVKDQWENTSVAEGIFRSLPAPPPAGGPPSPPPAGPGSPSPAAPPVPSPSFAAPPPADRDPPRIVNARATLLAPERVQIVWQTNEAADSRLTLMEGAVSLGTVRDATYELEHALTFSSALTPGADYVGIIASRDPNGNETTERLPLRIPERTPENSPVPSPAPLPRESPASSTITPVTPPYTATIQTAQSGTTIRVQWNPPAAGAPPHGYRVDVFDTAHRLVRTETISKETSAVSLAVPANERYEVIVYGNTNGTLEKIGAPSVIETTPSPPERMPVNRFAFTAAFFLILAIPLAILIKKIAA